MPDQDSTTKKIMALWPVIVVIASLLMAGAVGQFQITAMAGEVEENAEAIEENEDDIEEIQRKLIRRQGEISLDLERLRDEQSDQSEKLDEVLDLLRQSGRD
jgi:outer membrane murein-binding lipoprotein Lpp